MLFQNLVDYMYESGMLWSNVCGIMLVYIIYIYIYIYNEMTILVCFFSTDYQCCS